MPPYWVHLQNVNSPIFKAIWINHMGEFEINMALEELMGQVRTGLEK